MRVLGNVTRVREASRAVWIPAWTDHVRQDRLTFAAVALSRPAIALVAALEPARRATGIEPAMGLRLD